MRDGVDELDDDKLKPLLELKYNTVANAKQELGSLSLHDGHHFEIHKEF